MITPDNSSHDQSRQDNHLESPTLAEVAPGSLEICEKPLFLRTWDSLVWGSTATINGRQRRGNRTRMALLQVLATIKMHTC